MRDQSPQADAQIGGVEPIACRYELSKSDCCMICGGTLGMWPDKCEECKWYATLAHRKPAQPAKPAPDTRVVGDGYAPGTDLPLHATVRFRDGSRVTMWRRGTVWSASPEPRSIDEIAAQPAPPAAGELPTGQFKIGDCVEAVPPFALVCGSGRYDYATVVSVSPFVLASEQGDMLWKTVSQEKVLRIGDATWSALYSGLGRYAKDAGLVSGDKWLTATAPDPGLPTREKSVTPPTETVGGQPCSEKCSSAVREASTETRSGESSTTPRTDLKSLNVATSSGRDQISSGQPTPSTDDADSVARPGASKQINESPDPGCFAGGDAGKEQPSVTELAARYPNLHEYLSQLETDLANLRRENADLNRLLADFRAEATRRVPLGEPVAEARVKELEAKLSNLPKSMAQLFDERDALTAKLAGAERRAESDSQKFGVAYIAWRERVLKLNNGQLILPDESQEEFEVWLSRAEWGDADDELTALRDRVVTLRGALEKLVVNLSDALKWNWTFQGLSKRDAADQVLATMVEVGLIEGWQHPMSFGGTGYSTYRINGRLYGRTDEPNGAPALAPEAPNGN